MSDISNTYRDQIRGLLLRRIEDARKRLLDENDAVVANALKAAEASPKIVELRALKQAYAARQEQIKTLEKERDEITNQFEKAVEGLVTRASSPYYHQPPDESMIENIKAKLVDEALASDPALGPKLKELVELGKQIGDLLVLALTTTKLRSVVKLFNDRLGASVSEVEKEILGLTD